MEIKDELLDIEGIKNSNKSLIDLFIRRTAVLTCTPESMVEKIVKDQWKQANKMTQDSSTVSEFDFCNLGTFYISPAKARKRLLKINTIKNSMEKMEEYTGEKGEKKKEVIYSRYDKVVQSINTKMDK